MPLNSTDYSCDIKIILKPPNNSEIIFTKFAAHCSQNYASILGTSLAKRLLIDCF